MNGTNQILEYQV